MSSVNHLPDITLLMGDNVVADPLAACLESIELTQALNVPAHCELTFILDRRIAVDIALGQSLTLSLDGGRQPLFKGELIAQRKQILADKNCRLVLRCYDQLHRLRKNQPLRQFKNLSLEALVTQILETELLKVDPSQLPALHCDSVYQWCQSDWRLLIEQLNQYGLHCHLLDDRLTVFNLLEGCDEHHLRLDDNLLSMSVEESLEPACREVQVNAWYASTSETFIKQKSDTEHIEGALAHLAPGIIDMPGVLNVTNKASCDETQAQQLATAILQERLAGELVVQAVAEGNPQLMPGCKVHLDAGGDYDLNEDTTVVIAKACHRFTRQQGYITEFSSLPPQPLSAPTIQSTFARVTSIDDPESQGRVQVSYPCLGDLESLWQPVVNPGAGSKKGLLALPDVDDEVLVIFAGGDINQGIVLGGLFGRQTLPKHKVKGDHQQIFNFTSGRGHSLVLDDSRGKATLKNRDGSYLDLAPGKVTLHADADLVIEAPGKSVVIKASSVDFQQN